MCWLRNLFLSAQWPLFTLCDAGYPEVLGNLPPPQLAGLEWQLGTFNPFCRGSPGNFMVLIGVQILEPRGITKDIF